MTSEKKESGVATAELIVADAREAFIQQFISIVQAEASNLGFFSPHHLNAETRKEQVLVIGGAPNMDSVDRLYGNVRRRLNCSTLHRRSSDGTLKDMALSYFDQLYS